MASSPCLQITPNTATIFLSTVINPQVEESHQNVKKYLLLCIEVEEAAARIYRQLSDSKNLPGELRVILRNLADDEDAHASQLRFALRFPAGTAIIEKTIPLAPIQALLVRAKDLLTKTDQDELNLKQAIETGIELEKDFCQVHLSNSIEFKDEGLKKMFAAMAQDDKIHCQKLYDAKARFL